MSWLNLNQSLSSLKGQITNFASEVLSEGPDEQTGEEASGVDTSVKELHEKCHSQELEIDALKRLTSELQASLQSERLSGKNGVKEDESSWYWDPPPQTTIPLHHQTQEGPTTQMRERNTLEIRSENEELNRLREENKNLTNNLEDLDNQHQMAMERLLTLKKELQKNFEVLKKEHEDLKSTNEVYSAENKELLVKLSERDKEIEDLKSAKSDYDTLLHKYQNLERIHSLLRENAEKFQEENQDLHEEIFKLQEQVTKLEHDVEIATKLNSDIPDVVPKDKYEELLKQLNDLKIRRSSDQMHLDEINIDDNAKGVIETLKRDISELKHKLAVQKSEADDDTDNKAIKSDKIIQLYNKHVSFDLPVDYVGEIPSANDNIVLYKLESVFKTLNSFKKDIDTLEHKISEKNLNINHLQTQIDDLTNENEYLTTDIQHFESELDEMKKNNDFLISEIAALKNTSKLEPIIETHEDNLAKLETELDNCNKMNKNFESEILRIEKELSEVKIEKKMLQDSLTNIKNKYTSMLSELEMCKIQTKAVEELENNLKEENTTKAKLNTDEMDDLRKRLNIANSKNEQLSIDIHIIENDKVLLTKQVDDLKNALELKSCAHKKLESLKSVLEMKLKDLENKLDQVNVQKNIIESEKKGMEEKISVLNSQKQSDEHDRTKNETSQLLERVDNLSKENLSLTEKVNMLTKEINDLKEKEQSLLNENNSLKQTCNTEHQTVTSLRLTIDELKSKVEQVDLLNEKITSLQEENKKLLERKLQLEVELSSTDSKIVHLEEEFDKLIGDINEKDTLISDLNITINRNNETLTSLTQNITDLENSITVKNQEIEHLKVSFEDINQKFNLINTNSNQNQEELSKLISEKEDLNKLVFELTDDINFKNDEISQQTTRLHEIEKMSFEYKSLIDSKSFEIKESIVELTDKMKSYTNTFQENDDSAKHSEEKTGLENTIANMNNTLLQKDKELEDIKQKAELYQKTCTEYKTIINNATVEKSELINLINLKHNESIQYHNEIQRLNHVIMEQNNEFKRIIEEKDALLQNNTNSCANCEMLSNGLRQKDEIIVALNQNISEYERVKAEFSKADETVRSLTKRCEELDKSLTIQLETVKKLTAENVQLSEQEQNSTRELERLRHHLMETEENYTQELMASEQKLTECQTRLYQVEERAKQTSTVYTSNSIRANQEVETLRNQIKLLEKQREEVQGRLSDADDARSRSEAALTNLQVVLEQFQLDKERDIHSATEKIRNKMAETKRQNEDLRQEIARLNSKLEESLAGLQAATRLGDQVETKAAQINDLKEQVRALQTTVSAAEERYHSAISNQQDKVDKNLVKNLVINYVQTAGQQVNRTQILRVLSTVLDFNQRECEKLGLVRSTTTPDSLAAEFVKFLQNESRPRAPLPDMMTLKGDRATPVTSRKSSTSGPHPIFDLGHRRNPSTGSNNLLFQNIDNIETASQVSGDSETRVVPITALDTGVNQTRNNEGAILKHVLKDM